MLEPNESKKTNLIRLAVDLPKEDRLKARKCAKAKGMLFQSWLGMVIRRAVAEETSETADGAAVEDR